MDKAKILLVDDEPNVTQGLKRTLHREPYEVFTADSAEAAMKVLASHEIDLVISDERMPGTPGSEFLARVREAYPDTVRIILSGQAQLDDVIRAINHGEIYRFCLKPVNASEILSTIRQALQHKELLVQSRRLLREYQRRAASLEELERSQPGITRVETDAEGAILVSEADDGMDVEGLLREIETTLAGSATDTSATAAPLPRSMAKRG